jgi:prophage antirepressor-like protein
MLTDDERVKRLAVVSDAGMLSMIRSSLKPEAQQVKKWALHYLIPEAKTTGGQYFQSTISK